MRLSDSMPVKYTKVWADFYYPKNFGGCQVTWNEWVSIVLLRYLLFCLCYVRLVRPVFIPRCECCVTVLGSKCGADVVKECLSQNLHVGANKERGDEILTFSVVSKTTDSSRLMWQHKTINTYLSISYLRVIICGGGGGGGGGRGGVGERGRERVGVGFFS